MLPNSKSMILWEAQSRTAAPAAIDVANSGCRGVIVYIDTRGMNSNTATVTISEIGPNGEVFSVLVSAALGDNAKVRLIVYPGITAASNVSTSSVIGKQLRISVALANGNACVFGAGLQLIP